MEVTRAYAAAVIACQLAVTLLTASVLAGALVGFALIGKKVCCEGLTTSQHALKFIHTGTTPQPRGHNED